MTIQHIELQGERYVILLERDFVELQRRVPEPQAAQPPVPASDKPRYREVTPLKVGGTPVSEMIIQDRR